MVLRLELQGRTSAANCYDGIIETASDLSDQMLVPATPGSLMYCQDDGKVYLKMSDGSWEATK